MRIPTKQVASNTQKIQKMSLTWPKQAWMAAVVQYDIKEASHLLRQIILDWNRSSVGPELVNC